MPKIEVVSGLFLVVLLLVNPGYAQNSKNECPYPKGRLIEDISAVLAAHTTWAEQRGWETEGIPGRANLCRADLRNADLQEANLNRADLQWAYLAEANLQGANLEDANLQGAYLGVADLREAYLREANLQDANLNLADLQGANLSSADLQEAYLGEAILQGAYLSGANLQGAYLGGANLRGANLRGANLQVAFLLGASLQEADMRWADLEKAALGGGDLQDANLTRANLEGADLTDVNLRDARLDQSILSNAILLGAELTGALYQPATAPASGSLSGLKGIRSVWFCPGEASGLVQLRQALKSAGLRGPEREITYRLESIRTDYALARWSGLEFEDKVCSEIERKRIAAIEGLFRLVFFEWTTAYGLAYGRPILILLTLIAIFTLVYLPALLKTPEGPVDSGIFRIWPQGRIERKGTEAVAAKNVVIERLKPRGLSILGLAFYFSVISAFHLGWRDLNVGTWIARLQPQEYALRAKGWVRIVSGAQSLISVYLVAMWVLTYFGRPFG